MGAMQVTKSDPRKVFSSVLKDIGAQNEKVLAVSCDSASGSGLKDFLTAFPDRYIENGISEQNAIGVCAGLAEQGFIPVVTAITPFITMRCYEQVRDDIGYSKMNVKIAGSGAGLAYSTLGSTHEAIEDVDMMRSIPNMVVLAPADGYEVEMALKEAVAHTGPVYIRMPRQPLEDIADRAGRSFKIGKAEVVEEGSDIVLLSNGPVLREAQKAAQTLKGRGLDVGVVDLHTIKPIDSAKIQEIYGKCKALFTIEEHSIVGGLGSAVADVIAPVKRAVSLHCIGLPQEKVITGPYREVLQYYSLTSDKLVETIRQYI